MQIIINNHIHTIKHTLTSHKTTWKKNKIVENANIILHTALYNIPYIAPRVSYNLNQASLEISASRNLQVFTTTFI